MQRTYGRKTLRRRPHEHGDTSPPRKRRGNIVKRMLGRSKTESSLEHPNVQVARRAASHSPPNTILETERGKTPDAPVPIPTRNIRTYAGSSRSFLVALPVPDANALNAIGDDTESHESYSDLRTRWGIDVSEDQDDSARAPALRPSEPPLPVGMMNDLKSITELRSKGENRRFLDEVGYLFEGLDGSSAIGLRRASALEIVSKLCDLDFNRRAKTSDFYIRTWNKLWEARGGTSDKIFDITITFFAALAARDLRTIVDAAHQKEFTSTLVEILGFFDHSKDVLALVLAGSSDDHLKSHGILRTEITALRSLARLVSNESHASSLSQPSARFLVSHSLATLPPSFLEAQHLPTLLINMRAELGLLEPRLTAYESGFPLLPAASKNGRDIPSLSHVEACLRLLDSYLLGHWSSGNPVGGESATAISHMNGFTSDLMSLCVVSSSLCETEGYVNIARKCLCGAMRVLTLLSHDDPWWCDAALKVPCALPFATMAVMQSQAKWSELHNMESQNNAVEVFDLLCLALGLVMNWATLSPDIAVLSRLKSINPKCPRSRLCVRACRCPDQKSILECFATLHAQYFDGCQDDPAEHAFLRGYTAILLGLLMKDDVSNQTIVLSTLPGTSTSDKLKTLITHCHSFLDLYNDTTPLPASDSPDGTPEGATHEAADHRKAAWDKRGEDIARSVIASLEILRDN